MDFIEIGKLIRDARKAQQLSQADIAVTLGMSRATISSVENGTFTELGIRKYLAICHALGLTLLAAQKNRLPTYHELKSASTRQNAGLNLETAVDR